MSISWRSSAAAFEQILGRHGVGMGACTMEAAWAAFEAFPQVPIEVVEGSEDDGDSFIVEWGGWDRTGNRPAMFFGRLPAVDEGGDRQDPYGQPQYWKVEFQACFAEAPAWADLNISGGGNSGFDPAAIGEPRADALAATRRFIDQAPLLGAMRRSAPIDIEVTLDRAG
ncbi:hypothetical protein [Streptomyces virginiae]